MTALVSGLILVACMVGFGFYLLLTQQKKGQNKTDSAALTMAEFFNKDDKLGQMNNVVARCRELVYVSRQNDDAATQLRSNVLQELSKQLLDEARSSALFVEAERKNEIKYLVKVTKDSVEGYNVKTPTRSTFSLPWFESHDPTIDEVSFGSIRKTLSNVTNSQGVPDLQEFDKMKNYFEPTSHLYRGNINAKLPEPDSDLIFKISSLPACVDTSVAPPRLTNSEAFISEGRIFEGGKFAPHGLDQLPSAIEIIQHMDVDIKNDANTIQLGSTAATSGAMPAP